jgi:hypothetical protein
MVGQTQIVVRGEHEDRTAVDVDPRPLRALELVLDFVGPRIAKGYQLTLQRVDQARLQQNACPSWNSIRMIRQSRM